MKLKTAFFFITVLCVVLIPCFAQETQKARLIDEFGKDCSEIVMVRYDAYMAQLGDDPNATGYIVFYGEDNFEGRNLNFISYLKEIYPGFRKYDKTRFVVLRGENRPQMWIQFWVVPAGANPPKPEKEFVSEKIVSTTRFDKNWADFNYYNNEPGIYFNGFLEVGCEFSPNIPEFAKTLIADKDLTGYLVVYTKPGRGVKRGNKVAAFAVNDLVKNYKVPRSRLKTIYGGNRKSPEIELWLVPKNDKPPARKPDSKPKK